MDKGKHELKNLKEQVQNEDRLDIPKALKVYWNN